jgi:hypothetical protein
MCEPTTLLVLGTVFSAGAQIYAGNAAAQQGKYTQQVEEQNAKNSEQRARDATARGEQEAGERRLKTRLLIGSQRAALAGNGVDLQDGTALELVADEAMFGAIDEDRIRSNAAREAWGYRVDATNSRNRGYQARTSGNQQRVGSYLGAAATAFQAGSGFMSQNQSKFSKSSFGANPRSKNRLNLKG